MVQTAAEIAVAGTAALAVVELAEVQRQIAEELVAGIEVAAASAALAASAVVELAEVPMVVAGTAAP